MSFNPKLDLVFEKKTNLTPEQLWKGWTDPETLKKWFCPKPWQVTECRIELKPGGKFFTVMQGPEGERMPSEGCYLEVVPNQKLVWTNLMMEAYRPAPPDKMGFAFVGTVTFTKTNDGTIYKAVVAHGNEESRKQHEQMGFQEGWGAAFKQLEELYS